MDISFIKYLKYPFIPFYIIFFRSFCLINGIPNSPYQKDCLFQQLLFNCWRMFAWGRRTSRLQLRLWLKMENILEIYFYSIVKSIFLDLWSHCLSQYQIDFPLSMMHPDFPLHLSSSKDIYDCLFLHVLFASRFGWKAKRWENFPPEKKQLFPGKSNARQIGSFDRGCKCIWLLL